MQDTETATGKGFTVLLAEPDETEVRLIQGAFERLGLAKTVVVVPNGEEVLAYLQGEGKYSDRVAYPFPNIMLLECRLPALSGLGVLCWLRSEPRFECLPAVILSEGFSRAQMETMGRMRAACCSKSAKPKEIIEAVALSIKRALKAGPAADRSAPYVQSAQDTPLTDEWSPGFTGLDLSRLTEEIPAEVPK